LTLRYFGTAPRNDDGEKFNIQAHADDLAAFIRTLDLAPVTIVGWSFGGAVCLAMAVQNHGLVRRMFLYEPALATFVTAPEEQTAALEDRIAMSADARRLADAGDLAGALRTFMDGINEEPGTFDGLPHPLKVMTLENARMLPLLFAGPPAPSVTESDMRRLAVPVTLLHGAQTRPFYRIAAKAARSLLPNVEFKTIENGKHLWPIQAPEAFNRLLLDFLDSH